eukprot:TRINITY_DN2251_c0_g1_i3.p1 TRINITY_DN2251_c0_g1~~TRINITY_DN2251_c0_g1_i3.p1  ORF type:complete len:600 (+),score=83.52 TRINITY_DN2251_c0_g1_i3:369-2168(+)
MVATKDEKYPYHQLRLRLEGSILLIQPHKITAEQSFTTLMLDIKSGKIVKSNDEARLETDYMFFLGIAGMLKVSCGMLVAVITGAETVAEIDGSKIYKILEVTCFGEPDTGFQDTNDAYLADVFRAAFDPKVFGQGLYFSYDIDLTLNQQKKQDVLTDPQLSSKCIYQRADERFFWNKATVQPIIQGECHGFVLPILCGVVLQSEKFTLDSPTGVKNFQITTIARRSRERAGTRHWRRGADQAGFVANFVETEMISLLSNKGDDYLSSFVQIRGSIPLLWTHWPNIKYKPPLEMADPTQSQSAFDKHMGQLVSMYKEVVSVNLANQKKSEGRLSSAFREQTDRLSGNLQWIKLIQFDFHKELGASKYENLIKLWNQISKDFQQFGMFILSGSEVKQRQSGVFRTNCVDCLDRTNVVQAMLGRHAVETTLKSQNIMKQSGKLETDFPEIEKYMKIMWADHGDLLAIQYAGTGAMKSGFTRTGKRTLDGYVDDGYKAVARYYLNNFEDGRKQDAFDLISGTFTLEPDGQSGFLVTKQPSAFFPFWLSILSVWYGGYLISTGKYFSGLTLVCGGVGILYFLYQNGRMFVNKPILKVDQIRQW